MTTAERTALKARWQAKVRVRKSGCWGWAGAMSKTRNGERPVIRVGRESLSAARVGLALQEGYDLNDEWVRTAKVRHEGLSRVACVNPSHNVLATVAPAKAKRGAKRATRKR